MKISSVVKLIIGEECSILAVDICTIITYLAYTIILVLPFYAVYSILKYKKKK